MIDHFVLLSFYFFNVNSDQIYAKFHHLFHLRVQWYNCHLKFGSLLTLGSKMMLEQTDLWSWVYSFASSMKWRTLVNLPLCLFTRNPIYLLNGACYWPFHTFWHEILACYHIRLEQAEKRTQWGHKGYKMSKSKEIYTSIGIDFSIEMSSVLSFSFSSTSFT